jgi:hypothetical protein
MQGTDKRYVMHKIHALHQLGSLKNTYEVNMIVNSWEAWALKMGAGGEIAADEFPVF